jgi:hypothetical protein
MVGIGGATMNLTLVILQTECYWLKSSGIPVVLTSRQGRRTLWFIHYLWLVRLIAIQFPHGALLTTFIFRLVPSTSLQNQPETLKPLWHSGTVRTLCFQSIFTWTYLYSFGSDCPALRGMWSIIQLCSDSFYLCPWPGMRTLHWLKSGSSSSIPDTSAPYWFDSVRFRKIEVGSRLLWTWTRSRDFAQLIASRFVYLLESFLSTDASWPYLLEFQSPRPCIGSDWVTKYESLALHQVCLFIPVFYSIHSSIDAVFYLPVLSTPRLCQYRLRYLCTLEFCEQWVLI